MDKLMNEQYKDIILSEKYNILIIIVSNVWVNFSGDVIKILKRSKNIKFI